MRTRERAERLLAAVTAALPGGPHADAARAASERVVRVAQAPVSVALLAEGDDDHVVSHHLWPPLLGGGAPALTPRRSTLGYVTAVRLRAVARERAAVRAVSVSFLDRAGIARCRSRLLDRLGDGPASAADWPQALAQARRLWPAADARCRAGLTELVALHRAEVFAEHLLGVEGVPARLDAVHQATMPFHVGGAAGGVAPFPDATAPGPYEPGTELTESVLHRVFPVVRRVTVEVDVPHDRWPLADEPLDLIDLPVLAPHLRTGRADLLIEDELGAASAAVLLSGARGDAVRAVRGYPQLTVLTGPGSAALRAGPPAPAPADDLRAALLGAGRDAGRAARATRAHAAHLDLRRVLRATVAALDEEPPAAPPPPPAAQERLRDLVGRIGTELTALIDDVGRGVAGPEARLDGGMTPQDAVTQRVVARVHAWPQWAVLFAAVAEQHVQPGDGFDREEPPARPDVFEATFRATLRELPSVVGEVVDATVAAWRQRRSPRLGPLKAVLLDDVEPARERGDGDGRDAALTTLRRAVQLDWLTHAGPADGASPVDADAARQAFPLAPDRPLPWHDPHGPGRHQATVMRVRRELVEAVRRLAVEGLAVEQARRVDAIRHALRELRAALPRTDAEIRALAGVDPGVEPDPPQVLARRVEALLEEDDLSSRAEEGNRMSRTAEEGR
ncbi:hypothetical protein [Micromonospora carbonacea]|uniref:Dynamin family protein n=1 Tax=Micromonospora carbonacea TaxID=47853 RepID=A0A7H8XLE0_9ACTN|nr:hypothetical protein [Micromonospora carbonacea]MBB5827164.1 hypothetical protein [Micromonospora carbonacea]QLD25039.1 hypothetical protein HXZ27_13135 [Micromonospora carbonacea]